MESATSAQRMRPKVAVLLLTLGFGSGLPLLLTQSTLSLWLVEAGASLEVVGWVTMVSLPYSFKFLWAPAMDARPAPLTKLLGRRRSWMVLTQGLCAVSMGLMSLSGAAYQLEALAVCALLLSLASASQDVIVDAYRVERLPQAAQGTGAALAVLGYRLGMLVSGAGALYLAHYLGSWPWVYAVMSLCMALPLVVSWLAAEPVVAAAAVSPPNNPETSKFKIFYKTLWEPLRGLLTRPGWLLVLLFIMSFKIGDSMANRMLMPFLKSVGFEKLDLANIAKTYGIIASILGVLAGGWFVRRLGTIRALWVGGLLQAASNLVFVWQSRVGPDPWALVVTISVENLSGGLGTAAFVAYLSMLCDRRYTATQYALLTAASSIMLTLIGGQSGVLAEALGWSHYFMITALFALPGLFLLAWLSLRPQQNTPENI